MMRNLKEIVFGDASSPISQDECLFVIKEYVAERKGVEITPFVNPRQNRLALMMQLNLMMEMTNTAIGWFTKNPNINRLN